MRIGATAAFIAVLLSSAYGMAANGNLPPAKVSLQQAYRRIDAELASPPPAQEAQLDIQNMVKSHSFQCRFLLAWHWLPALMLKKQYRFVAQISKQEILVIPHRTRIVQQLLTLRAEALLAMGRPKEALACAKELFDFCTMRDTANALTLLARCLAAASPNAAWEIRRLQRQQIAGAAIPLPGYPPHGCPILAAVQVHRDDAAYARRAWGITGQGYGDLIDRGNLLLLADRPREAITCFNAAYLVADNYGQVARAAGRIAACIKAEDGVVGPANAWADRIGQ
jgi:tetratricopeptide (TPR) repeat protein